MSPTLEKLEQIVPPHDKDCDHCLGRALAIRALGDAVASVRTVVSDLNLQHVGEKNIGERLDKVEKDLREHKDLLLQVQGAYRTAKIVWVLMAALVGMIGWAIGHAVKVAGKI